MLVCARFLPFVFGIGLAIYSNGEINLLFSLVLLDTKRVRSGCVKNAKDYLFAPLRVAPNNLINKEI